MPLTALTILHAQAYPSFTSPSRLYRRFQHYAVVLALRPFRYLLLLTGTTCYPEACRTSNHEPINLAYGFESVFHAALQHNLGATRRVSSSSACIVLGLEHAAVV